MAQQSLTNVETNENGLFSSSELLVEDMRIGLIYPSEEVAVDAILKWGEKALCPLSKARRTKTLAESGGKTRGRRCLDCPHSRSRKKGENEIRQKQRYKFTKCPVSIVINENDDGSWEISKATLEHFGHQVSQKDYYVHEHTKRLRDEDKEYLKELKNVKANAKNIAACLSHKTGKNYNSQDIRNLIKKMDDADITKPKAEEILAKVKDAGGNVNFSKDSTKNVDVLWIQTQDMVAMLKTEKPRLFQCDTTFGTQREGYKLHIIIYHSNTTDMWEVAGLLFLSSEIKEKVETGFAFIREGLTSAGINVAGDGPLLFYLDKDFDYIDVIEAFFPTCYVFLCFIHTRRYFKDKVFTGKAQWKDGSFLTGGDKEQLLLQLSLVRDSPTEDVYKERETKFLGMTRDLTVRAGQAVNAVLFHDYYFKNWRSCSFRWVLAYRKNLPTKGCNDTQAVESTFSAIKRFSKSEFGNRTPTLTELIDILPRILDGRSENRQRNIFSKRLVIYHKDPKYRLALEAASWELNAGGMRVFHQAIEMCDTKEKHMKLLDDDRIEEKYTGRQTSSYVGFYSTNGKICNCSWFGAHLFCRHIILFRKVKNLPIFESNMFHKSFLSKRFASSVGEDICDEDNDDDFDGVNQDTECLEDDEVIPSPASPGMEHLLREQMEANKKLPKNVKYNKAFDVAKQCAEYLKDTPNQMFDVYLQCFKKFASLLRDGMSLTIVDFLENPSAFELKRIMHDDSSTSSPSSPDISPAETLQSSVSVNGATEKSSSLIVQSSKESSIDGTYQYEMSYSSDSCTKEVPDHLKDVMQLDCVVKEVPGDGACLFTSTSLFINGTKQKDAMKRLRKESHRFIVKNWNHYESFFILPFKEQVGVGRSAWRTDIKTYEDLKKFLLSDSSLYCFSNSSLDLTNLANMFDMRIAIFTYSSGGSVVPHWTWVHPDPAISSKSENRNKLRFKEMWLFNEDDSHYDLLAPRPIPNALPGPAAHLPVLATPSLAPADSQPGQGWMTEEISTLTEILPEEVPHVPQEVLLLPEVPLLPNECPTVFSPMDFLHCPRGVGRPKKKRFGAPSLLKSRRKVQLSSVFGDDDDLDVDSNVPDSNAPKKRGRPKGSKNKNKDEPNPKNQKKTLKERAEEAARFNLEEDSETCPLCLFRFDDPMKKDKIVTRCTACQVLVHEPCLVKSGCDCEFN